MAIAPIKGIPTQSVERSQSAGEEKKDGQGKSKKESFQDQKNAAVRRKDDSQTPEESPLASQMIDTERMVELLKNRDKLSIQKISSKYSLRRSPLAAPLKKVNRAI